SGKHPLLLDDRVELSEKLKGAVGITYRIPTHEVTGRPANIPSPVLVVLPNDLLFYEPIPHRLLLLRREPQDFLGGGLEAEGLRVGVVKEEEVLGVVDPLPGDLWEPQDLGGDGILELRVVGEDRGVGVLPHLPKRADRLLLRAVVSGGVAPGVVARLPLTRLANGHPYRPRWEVGTLPDALGLEV